MWREALVIGLVVMAVGMVVGGAVEKADIGLGIAYYYGKISGKAAGAGGLAITGGSLILTGLKEAAVISAATFGGGLVALGILA